MIEPTTAHKLSYGLFVITTREGGRDYGCIINTAQQITSTPYCLAVTVNKQNFTHDKIRAAGLFNISVLDETAPFSLFQQFGFQSGRDVDKFAGMNVPRTENGLPYVETSANCVISCRVTGEVDCGTHTLFLAEVVEARNLSDTPSVTYAYYFAHIKPQVQPAKKKGWVCKICGYVYEGEELPPDYICPLCKHGAEDFVPLT